LSIVGRVLYEQSPGERLQERDRLDAADIRRIRAGDAAAFQGLVDRHARRVHDLARRMLRDRHEAEDIA